MISEEFLDHFIITTKELINVDIIKENGNELKYEEIDSYISRVENIFGIKLSQVDHDKVFHIIEESFFVEHTHSYVIYDDYDKVRDWYKNENIKEPYFWPRYRRYLSEYSSLDPKSIKLLDEKTLPEIMNCLADPNEEFEGVRLRKGLVIGDVQSGKTATYSGLICKAVDAGYKVVILLAGITESLRRQTQERIDEGIVGVSSWIDPHTKKPDLKIVGVGTGKGKGQLKASSYTTLSSDFTGNKDNIIFSLTSHSSVVLFVIKKNVSVLSRLYRWLKNYNYDESLGYIDVPLLFIDDEADNASLNTNKDETNPTKINSKIRKICGLFKNATYIGFTATPFANIFINPNTVVEMASADLFPEHFMYVLPTPSTYIGADKIFYDQGEYSSSIKYIQDIEEPDYNSEAYKNAERTEIESLNNGPFYYRHKKEWDGILPGSLTDAIYCFFLANIIRDLRGDSSKPRSMLINMSRFTKVQHVIREHVEKIYHDFFDSVRIDFVGGAQDEELVLYQKLSSLWDKHFSNVKGLDVSRVLQKENILKAVEDINVIEVNASKDSKILDYKNNPSLRVIAVGGIALSRGLTLEGLIVSYFYRNTATFDVLMQMGRWFGYRRGYEDIFQIWTSVNSARWYEEISKASDELKEDLNSMFEQKLTPKDFGIRVRDDCEELEITAFNKRRHSHKQREQFSFYGNLHETPYVSLNTEDNRRNLEQFSVLVSVLRKGGFLFEKTSGENYTIVRDVPKSVIANFSSGITSSKVNPTFDPNHIKDFIEDKNSKGLDMWDVVFLGGDSPLKYDIKGLEGLNCLKRAIHIEQNAVVLSSRRRLLNTNAGRLGLNKDQVSKVREACIEQWNKEGKDTNRHIPAKAYFEYLPDRKPILIISLIVPNSPIEDEKLSKFIEQLGEAKIVAFAMGFPGLKEGKQTKHYAVNEIYYQQFMQDESEEEGDE